MTRNPRTDRVGTSNELMESQFLGKKYIYMSRQNYWPTLDPTIELHLGYGTRVLKVDRDTCDATCNLAWETKGTQRKSISFFTPTFGHSTFYFNFLRRQNAILRARYNSKNNLSNIYLHLRLVSVQVYVPSWGIGDPRNGSLNNEKVRFVRRRKDEGRRWDATNAILKIDYGLFRQPMY